MKLKIVNDPKGHIGIKTKKQASFIKLDTNSSLKIKIKNAYECLCKKTNAGHGNPVNLEKRSYATCPPECRFTPKKTN